MTIILWSPWNFASMESIWLECNPTVDLSKFTYNNKILNGVISLKVTPGVINGSIVICEDGPKTTLTCQKKKKNYINNYFKLICSRTTLTWKYYMYIPKIYIIY